MEASGPRFGFELTRPSSEAATRRSAAGRCSCGARARIAGLLFGLLILRSMSWAMMGNNSPRHRLVRVTISSNFNSCIRGDDRADKRSMYFSARCRWFHWCVPFASFLRKNGGLPVKETKPGQAPTPREPRPLGREGILWRAEVATARCGWSWSTVRWSVTCACVVATYRGVSSGSCPVHCLRREGYEPSRATAHGDGPHARPAVDCSRPTLAKGASECSQGARRRPPRPRRYVGRPMSAHGQRTGELWGSAVTLRRQWPTWRAVAMPWARPARLGLSEPRAALAAGMFHLYSVGPSRGVAVAHGLGLAVYRRTQSLFFFVNNRGTKHQFAADFSRLLLFTACSICSGHEQLRPQPTLAYPETISAAHSAV